MMKIGMNLNEPNYWTDDFPLLDRMKCSGAWQGTGAQYDGGVHTVDASRPYLVSGGETPQHGYKTAVSP